MPSVRRAATLIALAVAAGVFSGAGAVPAFADSTVSTWDELSSAFESAPLNAPTTITLASDISVESGPDSSLSVPNLGEAGAANITLNLNGHALSIAANTSSFAGIEIRRGASLTITDSAGGGTLDVTGGADAAGMGISYVQSDPIINDLDPAISGYAGGGTVVIAGGTVTATGGDLGSGIGGAYYYGGGNVSITGGTVHAIGGSWAAGIGNGMFQYLNPDETNISIAGGTVTAVGGLSAPGIGRGTGTDVLVPQGALQFGCASVTATGGDAGNFYDIYDLSSGAAVGAGAEVDAYLSVPAPLTLDGVPQAGAPLVAGTGGGQFGGIGSPIEFTNNPMNQLTLTASTPGDGQGATFTLECVSAAAAGAMDGAALAATGSPAYLVGPAALAAIVLGAGLSASVVSGRRARSRRAYTENSAPVG